ncbi:cupin domain [Herbihabitans rhizosphaerae]|uniref:Cupin domain n=1 Tax=Herbihabitans rhizosphaerae TaxID=1872711 RepID=A0A4Q7KP72_9PSEU|nr:cupin domain-containing protein [Herbihabitans rhizosphaerae]RZS37790.1 cupin domain [Herbihabitans rhizosphaerae]
MVKTGDTLRQGDTDTMVFRKTSADTGGEYLEVEATYGPMGDLRPPAHYHPIQTELFQVLEGTLVFLLDGEEKTLNAGDELHIPKRVTHAAWNPGDVPARFVWRTTPAMRTEEMFKTMWNLVEDGKMGRHGNPRPPFLQSMAMMYGFRKEWRLTAPPYPVYLPLCAALSVPARLLGYRAIS